jgi:hypothetical protein
MPNSMTIKLKSNFVLLMTVIVALGAMLDPPVFAAQPRQGEAEAMAVLKKMTEFLAQARSFSVTAETGFDALQDSGEKIEFGETRKVTLHRPDRLRIDETKRNGTMRQFIFDGKEISVFQANANVYASTARPGSVDDALSYLINDLGMRLPLSEMLSSAIARSLPEKVRSAAYVERSFIAGVACDHVVFYGDKAVMQLWVARGAKPLPQRVVITYIHDDGQPQFWAQFSNWDLAPVVSDSFFVFAPPPGARKVAFSPREKMQPGAQVSGRQGQR